MNLLRAFLCIVLFTGTATAAAASSQQRAEELFERYQSLAAAFDPAAADLYADDAVITNRRTYPTGEVRELSLPAAQYKELVRAAMPLAKSRGDTNTYSDVQYAIEGDKVRVSAQRYSELKKYTSTLVLVLGPGPDGRWQVLEEHSESRP